MSRFLFPRWSNALLPFVLVVGAVLPLYAAMFVAYGFSPKTLEVGYMPKQPVPYSHALHAGTLGIDCRYCHSTVEQTGFAAIPPTQTCMNCHTQIQRASPRLDLVRKSYETGHAGVLLVRETRGEDGGERAADAVAGDVDVGFVFAADPVERGAAAELQVFVPAIVFRDVVGRAPRDHVDGEALIAQPRDERVRGRKIEHVVFVDPRREDEDGRFAD